LAAIALEIGAALALVVVVYLLEEGLRRAMTERVDRVDLTWTMSDRR
jgi:hypothetical protein